MTQAEREKEKKAQQEEKRHAKQEKKMQAVADFAQESQRLQESTASALQKGLHKLAGNKLMDARHAAIRREKDVILGGLDDDLLGPLDGDDDNDGDNGAEDDLMADDDEYTIYDTGHVTCDECGCAIVGIRWHSLDQEDFDLCDKCRISKLGEDSTQGYLKVIQSAPKDSERKTSGTNSVVLDLDQQEDDDQDGQDYDDGIISPAYKKGRVGDDKDE